MTGKISLFYYKQLKASKAYSHWKQSYHYVTLEQLNISLANSGVSIDNLVNANTQWTD